MLLKGKYKKIEPASGAIIMAGGILLIGTIEAFPILDAHFGKVFAFILLFCWLVIYRSLSWQFFHKDFFYSFINHPVKSFTIGTWIAGVSVLCNVFLKYFTNALFLTQVMAVFNTFLWFFFFVICLYNFKMLLTKWRGFPVDGVVLLSTVGMQSIIVLFNNVLFKWPTFMAELVVLFGLLFYVCGMYLILKRYLGKAWTLVDDWANTNCIIHGALSITGLAVVSANAFSSAFVMWLWWLTFVLLVIIEGIEIVRAFARVRKYGWEKGLFTYNISQWSRNFTFGMFFTFTLYIHHNPLYHMGETVYHFQKGFLGIWAWVVLLALVMEIGIYLKSRMITSRKIML